MKRTVPDPRMLEAGSSVARVAESAAALGLDIEIARMEQSTRTAEEAAAACGCELAQIVKSLIFEDASSGRLTLLLVSGAHNADLEFIEAQYGLSLRRCDARRVRDETGFAIGGVAPIGHKVALPVHMDRELLGFDTVWAAAGGPDSVFRVGPKALADAIAAAVISVRPSGGNATG